MFCHSKRQNSRALSRFRLWAHHVRSSLARVFSSAFEDSTIDLWVDFHRSLGQIKPHILDTFFPPTSNTYTGIHLRTCLYATNRPKQSLNLAGVSNACFGRWTFFSPGGNGGVKRTFCKLMSSLPAFQRMIFCIITPARKRNERSLIIRSGSCCMYEQLAFEMPATNLVCECQRHNSDATER